MMPANRIREFREKLNLTQVEAARRARIAPSNWSSIENGRLLAWPKAKKKMARVLKVRGEELFPQEDIPNGK